MASASFCFLTLAILMITGTLAFKDQECDFFIPSLVADCDKYVKVLGPKERPSQRCCSTINNVDSRCIPYLCKLLTPEVKISVSMEKVVFVGRSCGLTIQPGMKCGSFTVPPV